MATTTIITTVRGMEKGDRLDTGQIVARKPYTGSRVAKGKVKVDLIAGDVEYPVEWNPSTPIRVTRTSL